ncbi:RNA-binding S4 domain-containing protein [Actinomyces sp. 2119]|uniref:RNA-binding S4 domain-containing protein n=1 Tax=Actinomyces lilanjuaniae TaxID=2321394 RepID=A0ABN5PN70_9ACTO|nr:MULTISPECIES: S4 domain-containing protein [Actinomyces]AYD89805.1 RNA-binding S4 domain-containing protein [Actinomyces lilanjuaniae]RJF44783.1 RNA-binding S4 domain-containing protein [Actinomyces sp. 2119]
MTRASAHRHGPAKVPRQAEEGDPTSVRVDVWLWSVRQVRSRSAATAACRAGHVRVNGDTAKPSQHLAVGDEVRLRVNGFDRYLRVERILVKRVGAQVARTAFTDFSPPRPSPLDAPAAVVRSRGAGRPTKKERRQLDALMGGGRRRSTTSARDDSEA